MGPALAAHFRYNETVVREDREHYSTLGWFTHIKNQLLGGGPLLYMYPDHMLVCDGWRETTAGYEIHLNYGWGSTNYIKFWFLDDIPDGGNPDSRQSLLRGISPRCWLRTQELNGEYAHNFGAWLDADGDGDQDLIHSGSEFTLGQFAVTLHRNHEGLSFGSEILYLHASDMTLGLCVGDFDNDGREDVLRCASAAACLLHNDGLGDFSVNTDAFSVDPSPIYSASACDLDNDGLLDLVVVGANAEVVVYHNTGGAFAAMAGVLNGVSATSLSVADIDDDGDLDMVLVSDVISPYVAFIENTGGLSFVEHAAPAELAGMRARIAIWGDVDNDGDLDLLVSSLFGSQLWRNEGSWSFSGPVGEIPHAAEAAAFGDYNNDGELDVYMTAFHPLGGTEGRLLRNEGAGYFVYDNLYACIFESALSGSGVAWADYDGNGTADLFQGAIWRNRDEKNEWIAIELRPTVSNKSAIGAKVLVTTADGRTQRRDIFGSIDGRNRNSNIAVVGLGGAGRAERIEVVWPSGAVQVREGVPSKMRIVVEEPLPTGVDGVGGEGGFGVKVCPNPGNGRIEVEVSCEAGCAPGIKVYDVRGRLVRRLFGVEFGSGVYRAEWDGRDEVGRGMASGVYYVAVDGGGKRRVVSASYVK